MHENRRARQTLVLGITISILGLLCLGGGLVLLAWRLLSPEEAIILPPGVANAPEMTPTTGLLGSAIAPPPLPNDLSEIVILPVSERSSPTPEDAIPTETVTASPNPSPTSLPTNARPQTPTRTPFRIRKPTATDAPATRLTPSPPPTSTPTLRPTATPSPTVTSSPTPTPLPAIPDRILIDAIGLDAPVVPVGQHPLTVGNRVYSQWDVPDIRAAGWHQNSAPLGVPGNTVLNGHHNVNGEVFRYLVALKPGDVIEIESRRERLTYIVVQTMTLAEDGEPIEVRRDNARWTLPTEDERVTLISCWPPDASTHRLVVVALPEAVVNRPPELP